MADNPFLPSKLQTLGMMLSGLGSGISAASARNLPFYAGIAPGVQAFQQSYYPMLQRGAAYDLQNKNYELNKSVRDIQAEKLALETSKIKQDMGFRDKALEWLNGGGSGGAAPPPGIRAPAGPKMGPDFGAAIKANESGGNYGAVGPDTGHGRAYGAYQVMDFNIPSWTQEVLGKAMTPQEFLANPQAQDAVFKAKFGQYVQQYGTPQDAASVWFSGKPLAGNNAADVTGTTVPQYVQRFNRNLYGAQPSGQPDTSFSPAASPPGAAAVSPPGGTAGASPLPGMPQMPGPPPDTTRLDALGTMNVPGVSDIAKAKAEAIKRQYQFQKDQYTRDFNAWVQRNQIASNDVVIDPNTGLPTVNQAKIAASSESAAAQEKAKRETDLGYDASTKLTEAEMTRYSKDVRPGVEAAANSLPNLYEMKRLASGNIMQGPFVDTRMFGERLRDWLGLGSMSEGAINRSEFINRASRNTLGFLQTRALGSGSGISEGDRQFVETMSLKKGDFTQEELKRLTNIAIQSAQTSIQQHNDQIVPRLQKLPGVGKIDKGYFEITAPSYDQWLKENQTDTTQTQGAPSPGTVLGHTKDGREVYVGPDGKRYVR